MRKNIESQLKIGEVDISQIQFDLRCRDEIPKLLMGLQHLYCTLPLREEIFSILQELIPQDVDPNRGRNGMELWKILVLGTLRLNCNWDYDKLQDSANNHKTLRLMLGHVEFEDDKYYYPLQTLKDNVSLFTPEILDKINQVVVKAGHNLVKKKEEEKLACRCDSFVVETDVHFPTDINLLFDVIKKVMFLYSLLCESFGFTFWRQWQSNLKKVKKLYTKAQRMQRSTSGNAKKKAARIEEIKLIHTQYITLVESYLDRIEKSWSLFNGRGASPSLTMIAIDHSIRYGRIFIDQIHRRVINEETIAHSEKIFSIFEPHTEWISKGKAGVSQELGLRVSIVEDQYGFILHHTVMEKQIDADIAVSLIRETKSKFPEMFSCSFDKGYWRPENYDALTEYLSVVGLRKKGRRNKSETERETSSEFAEAYTGHAAVESGINALENHGLDRCLDHGISGFKRYVSLAIVARNIQKLGHFLQQQEYKRQKRQKKIEETWSKKKLKQVA